MDEQAPIELGTICYSKSGRDKGRYYAVVGIIDDQYVLIADGMLRKLSKPKKKKLKHLRMKPIILDTIGGKLKEGKKVFDAELKSALINSGLITHKEKED